jgi:peroxiredoxin Q/BCP
MEYVFIGILVVSTLLIGGLMLAQSGEPPARGREAPAFDLPGTDGARHSPATWKGRPVVLFFFPMDDTPECLAVVARYREAAPRIEAAGARLFAVAVATPDEAKAYAHAQSIPFPVLADESGRAAKAWGTLTNFGFYKFAKKLTVIVDAGGRVERLWRDGVGPGHVDEVLAALGSRTG